jgi:hypothetical protein
MRFLLQIHRIKLQDYIQSALIASDKYLGDEIEKDIQSKNPNFLVLSDGYFKELDEYQILLELILTDEEKEKLIKVDDVYYIDVPLPITRIKKIYVQNDEIKNHIIINVNNSEKGFITERLFDTFEKDEITLFEKKNYSKLSNNASKSDFINEITLYNKRLGMFSFMKNTNIYYTNNTKEFSNYSDRYLITLKDYLTIEKDNSDLLDVLKQNIQFKELLYSDNQIDKEFIESVHNNIGNAEIKEIFSKVLEPNNILKTLPLLLEKEAYIYYFICLVYYFRQKDSNKKDNFKIEIENLIPKDIAQTALAILGIYFGYKILRANERIELNDEVYKQIFGNLFNMKFKLDSKLDYITIEILYQRSFYKELGRDFEYLEYPQNIENDMNFTNEEEFKQNYKYEEIETFFDKLFFKITKIDGIEND